MSGEEKRDPDPVPPVVAVSSGSSQRTEKQRTKQDLKKYRSRFSSGQKAGKNLLAS